MASIIPSTAGTTRRALFAVLFYREIRLRCRRLHCHVHRAIRTRASLDESGACGVSAVLAFVTSSVPVLVL